MLGETLAHDLCLFFNELELCAKTAHGESLFFNKLELYDNIARQSYDKNFSFKMPFFMELAPFEALFQILSLYKLGNE